MAVPFSAAVSGHEWKPGETLKGRNCHKEKIHAVSDAFRKLNLEHLSKEIS
jgi:hypothetical protein